MRVRKLLVAVVLVSATFSSAGQTRDTRPKFDRDQFAIQHKKFVLDNGLTLLVHTDHSVPIVSVNSWYHVGSRNETRGKTGFAHLFEHFFFNGSENYPHGFREAMDDLGANNRNGTTSTDRTNFFEDVPVSALERTLYLEADRMGFLAGNLSKEMLERERGVVQNEKRQGDNQPYGSVFDRLVELIYPYSHPYSWSTIGSMADLNAATIDDVKEWYRTYYGPNNAVLALAGDITPERALELVKKYFDGIPPGPPLARASQWIPKLDRNLRDQMEDRVPQARIYRVYHVPGWKDAEYQYLDLFSSVLSGSKSALLDRVLIYEKEYATAVTAGMWDKELSSNLLITATVKPGVDVAVVEKELDKVLGTLLQQGPAPAELQRAQSRAQADFVRGIERLGGFGGRSDVLAESMTFGGSPTMYLDRLEVMAKATPTDVKAAAKKWVGDANHYTLIVSPYPALKSGQTAVNRKTLPILGDAPAVNFPAVQRATLSNGLQVMLLERHSTPIVNVSLAVDAGYAADSREKAGLAALTLNVLDEGTSTRDAFRIVDELDALGARISTGSSLDLSFVRLESLTMNLGKSMDILADVVRNPAFPLEMVGINKRQQIARIAQEKANPLPAAQRLVPAILYGDGHAYSNPLTGSGYSKTVESIGREDLVAWHRAWFHPNHSTMIVTGDVTMKDLMPELARTFGEWPRGEAPEKKLATVPRTTGRKVYLIDKPDAPQSVIVAAHVSEPGGQPEDLAIDTVMRNFGGMATSRLNRNLRLEKHWSYGTSGQIVGARGQRPFIVVAPVQTDKTKESLVEVVKELRGLVGERPLTGEEFASTMRSQTMRLPGRFETLAALEGAAVQLINFGYPDDYFTNYAKNTRALTEADLAGAATKFVRPGEVVWIIVGDLKKIEAGVRELNLGEVVTIEAR